MLILLRFLRFEKNISEEIRDLTAKDIGQTYGPYGTLGIYQEHWVEIEDIRQTLGRHWVFGFLMQDKTF